MNGRVSNDSRYIATPQRIDAQTNKELENHLPIVF